MKYIIICVVLFAAIGGLSAMLTMFIRGRMRKKPPRAVHVLATIGVGIVILTAVSGVYLCVHYAAGDEAAQVMSDDTAVSEIDGGYFFDGPGEDTALVFYPGAKVDAEAYAPLMRQLAENGIDCFLIKPTFRLAIFSPDAADKVIGAYQYDRWLTAGHLMGGVVAAQYAASHADTVDGVILLAAYPNQQLSDKTFLLSVYGSEDKVLDRGAYEDAKQYDPPQYEEIVIDGGNHSGFGDYGAQRGDGEATITPLEQRTQTIDAILRFVEKMK